MSMQNKNVSLLRCISEISENYGLFYVYVLSQPNGSPFYVGCGCALANRRRHRIEAHEAEASRGKKSRKCNFIRKLWLEGLAIDYSIDSWHNNSDEMAAREIELIDKLGRRDLGNGSLTNANGGGLGQINPSDEVRKSMSKPRNLTDEKRAKCFEHAQKTIRTPEVSAKRTAALRTLENRARVGEFFRDYYQIEENKERVVSKRRETMRTPEYRAKRSAATKAQFATPDARAAVSDFMKARWANGEVSGEKMQELAVAAVKAARADPEWSENFRAAVRNRWTPERRAVQAERMRAMRAEQKKENSL